MPQLEDPCPVCGADAEAHQIVYQKNGCAVRRCSGCGLGSAVVSPGFDPGALYGEEYFQGGCADGYADYALSERVIRAEARRSLNALGRLMPLRGSLLEIGCAYGFFLLEAQAYFQCRGVDVSPAAVRYARQRGLDVEQGGAAAFLQSETLQYDAAVLFDVIEHLPDPRQVLSLLHSRLKPGGCLMLTTGDWDSTLARRMGARWRLMTPPQHLFYFSAATLRALLSACGFEVLESSHPSKLVPLGLAFYQVTRRLGWELPMGRWSNSLAAPVNLFDALRVIARKR